jgi:hypothetical protein
MVLRLSTDTGLQRAREDPHQPINIDDVDVMNLGLGRSIYSPEQL